MGFLGKRSLIQVNMDDNPKQSLKLQSKQVLLLYFCTDCRLGDFCKKNWLAEKRVKNIILTVRDLRIASVYVTALPLYRTKKI